MTDLESMIRANASRTMNGMLLEIEAYWPALVELAIERASSIGVAEYGDASFGKTREQLQRERFEEYADAIFYWQVQHRDRE